MSGAKSSHRSTAAICNRIGMSTAARKEDEECDRLDLASGRGSSIEAARHVIPSLQLVALSAT